MLITLRIGPWLACWRTRSLGYVAKGEWMRRDWVRRCWEKLGHSTEGKKKKFPLDALDSRRRFGKPTIAIGLPRILKVNRRLVCYFHRSRVSASSFPLNLGFGFFDFGIFRFKIRVWIRFWYKTKGGFGSNRFNRFVHFVSSRFWLDKGFIGIQFVSSRFCVSLSICLCVFLFMKIVANLCSLFLSYGRG